MYCEIPKLTRCCFCMPLRRGLLIIGYLSLLNSAFGIILYSARVHHGHKMMYVVYDDYDTFDMEMNIALNCIDFVFSAVLIYGAHRHIVRCLKVYYYYSLTTVLAMIIMNIYFIYSRPYYFVEFVTLACTRCCIYFYLILLVRSLIDKLENTGLTYENQLQEIIAGDIKNDDSVYPHLPAEI